MATASGESPEKLEDMIVRAAESTAAHAQAAKAAIGASAWPRLSRSARWPAAAASAGRPRANSA